MMGGKVGGVLEANTIKVRNENRDFKLGEDLVYELLHAIDNYIQLLIYGIAILAVEPTFNQIQGWERVTPLQILISNPTIAI